MKFSIKILLLIIFILIHKAWQVIYLGYWTRQIRGNFFFDYGGVTHATMEDMVEDIIETLMNVPLKEVYLFSYGLRTSSFSLPVDNPVCQSILGFIKPKNKISKKKKFKVCSSVIDGKMHYKCGEKSFPTFKQALKYSVKKKCQEVTFGGCYILPYNINDPPDYLSKPPVPSPPNKFPVAPKLCFVQTIYTKKRLKKNSLSYKIWMLVWKDSGPIYYNEKLSTMFKTRFLKETNFYRQLHDSPPLRDSHKYLSASAQEHANLLAKYKTLFYWGSSQFGTVMGSIKSRYTSFTMKIWYDEIKDHDFKKNHLNTWSEEFTAMVWKGSKYLGVGIASNGDDVFVVLKFFPKGNSNNQFNRNVKKIIMSKAEK